MKLPSIKLMILALVIIAVAVFCYYVRITDYFTLEKLQENHRFLKEFVQTNYLLSVLIYIISYALLVACALPIVMPLSLIGGFLYGITFGLIYAAIGCLIGSVVSFLVLRHILAHWLGNWHSERIDKFTQKVKRYGFSYLLILHFLSVIPLLVINLVAAVAKIPLSTVIVVTLIGTLPLNVLCVYAGQQFSSIHSFNDIFSPTVIALLVALAVIACAPLFFKKIKGYFGI